MNLADLNSSVNYVSFNQDFGCFAVGTSSGFFICDTNPLRERFRRDFDDGGIGIVEMLFRCNILALVGGGKHPKYPKNKVIIFDDHQTKAIAELEFRSDVKGVKLRRDRIVVALETKVYVYNFADLKLLMQIETTSNPTGIIALSPSSNNIVLAIPSMAKGEIRVEKSAPAQAGQAAAQAPIPTIIPAAQSSLSQIAVDVRGTRLAAASQKGTLLRVFDTATGQLIDMFRRGSSQAAIQSLAFNHDGSMLAVSSDKGTIHFFHIQGENKTSRFKNFLPNAIAGDYFDSKWSFTSCTVPEVRCVCGFLQDGSNSLIVLGASGTYYKLTLTMDQSTKDYVVKEDTKGSFVSAVDQQ